MYDISIFLAGIQTGGGTVPLLPRQTDTAFSAWSFNGMLRQVANYVWDHISTANNTLDKSKSD